MKKFLGSIASVFMTAFFIGIVLFIQLGVVKILDEKTGTAFLVFSMIEFLILLIVIGFGKAFMSAVGDAMYMSICAMTVLYVLFSHVLNFILFTRFGTAKFVMINLIVMFLYMCIAVPIAVKGTNSKDDQYVDPMNPHNLPDLTPRNNVNNINGKEDR